MSHEIILGLLIFLSIVGYFPYLKDVIFGNTKPHIYTWLVWAIVNITTFAVEFSNGGDIITFVPLVSGIICTMILLYGLGNGIRNISKLDSVFLGLSALSLTFWIVLNNPMYAGILLALTFIFSLIPTIRKSIINPFEETISTYVYLAVSSILAIVLLSTYSVQTLVQPLTNSIVLVIFCIILIIRRKQIP